MKPFTALQREEILSRIDMREDFVEDDPESGDEFELTEGALEALRAKVNAGVMDFTEAESAWMVQEFENMEDIAWSNMRSEGAGEGERLPVLDAKRGNKSKGDNPNPLNP